MKDNKWNKINAGSRGIDGLGLLYLEYILTPEKMEIKRKTKN